jgi:hypothetical protein
MRLQAQADIRCDGSRNPPDAEAARHQRSARDGRATRNLDQRVVAATERHQVEDAWLCPADAELSGHGR